MPQVLEQFSGARDGFVDVPPLVFERFDGNADLVEQGLDVAVELGFRAQGIAERTGLEGFELGAQRGDGGGELAGVGVQPSADGLLFRVETLPGGVDGGEGGLALVEGLGHFFQRGDGARAVGHGRSVQQTGDFIDAIACAQQARHVLAKVPGAPHQIGKQAVVLDGLFESRNGGGIVRGRDSGELETGFPGAEQHFPGGETVDVIDDLGGRVETPLPFGEELVDLIESHSVITITFARGWMFRRVKQRCLRVERKQA